MGILDKIMGVSRKKESIPELDFGKGFGSKSDDIIGGMGDSAPGLGGTGDLGSMSPYDIPPGPSGQNEVIHGFGHEDVKMERADLRPDRPSFSRPAMAEPSRYEGGVDSKDIEIISVKIDAMKSQLEMINNRLSTIEMRIDDLKRRGGW